MSLQQIFDKHEKALRDFAARENGAHDYQQLAIQLGVSDDEALQLLHMANSLAAEIRAALESYEWQSLISLDTPSLPSLNLSLFPTWMGVFAQALSECTETPPELAGGMTLAVVAAAAARRATVQVMSGYTEPTCLWVAPGLEPANLKSANVNEALAPFQSWELEQAEILRPQIKAAASEIKTKEARIKALRAAAASVKTKAVDVQRYVDEITELEEGIEEIPIEPRLWTSDATPETFGAMLGQQGECMALISSEGAIIDILAGRYSGGTPNIDLFLKGHSGDSDVSDRLSRKSVRLNYPRITMGISPQPAVFNALASIKGGEGRGLLARFLYFLPASRLGYRTLDGPPIPECVRAAYHAGVHAMLNCPVNTDSQSGCYKVELSGSARAKWQEFRQWVEAEMRPEGSLVNHKKWAGKAAGAAVRIAGVLSTSSLCEGKGVFSDHFTRGKVKVPLEQLESCPRGVSSVFCEEIQETPQCVIPCLMMPAFGHCSSILIGK